MSPSRQGFWKLSGSWGCSAHLGVNPWSSSELSRSLVRCSGSLPCDPKGFIFISATSFLPLLPGCHQMSLCPPRPFHVAFPTLEPWAVTVSQNKSLLLLIVGVWYCVSPKRKVTEKSVLTAIPGL